MADEKAQTLTPDDGEGKLPLDIKAEPNADGNVKLARKDAAEATEPKKEAQDGKVEAQSKDGGDEAPPAKTYSEEDLNARVESAVGGHKGTIKKLTGDIERLGVEMEAFQTKAEDDKITSWLKSVEDGGGDVDYAKQVAQRERDVLARERASGKAQAKITEQIAELNTAGMSKFAGDLVKEYDLSDGSLEELLKVEDPTAPTAKTEMENKALRLALEKGKAQAQPPEKLSKGQGTTRGLDTSKMTDTERMGRAMDGQFD